MGFWAGIKQLAAVPEQRLHLGHPVNVYSPVMSARSTLLKNDYDLSIKDAKVLALVFGCH
ncbi:MAG: hypothetical protein KKD63_04375 [Proteobacteria bacterium]|nr:hypothetical protein [Desulfobulbaceae bacterium]MBU4152097.1 hypothetical protein [Pseudomonadota bacterium]